MQYFRQMLHVAFRIAAGLGERYSHALEEFEQVIRQSVSENIFDLHSKRVFL